MFLSEPCCICIKEDNFDLKGTETDVAGISQISPYVLGGKSLRSFCHFFNKNISVFGYKVVKHFTS